MGQFGTPKALADEIMRQARLLLPPDSPLNFIDPACGTGVFFSALLEEFSGTQIALATGYEVDPHYGEPARELWSKFGFNINLEDFTRATPQPLFDLLVCNPPYVRHHHVTRADKSRLRHSVERSSGISFSGLSGLYCYFLGLADGWLRDGGLACWIVPSEFMDVNYGEALKRYLTKRVTILQLHRFDPEDPQFSDALVSTAVLWLKKADPPQGHCVRFTFGGAPLSPQRETEVPNDRLMGVRKWSRVPLDHPGIDHVGQPLSAHFDIKRGVSTGANGFFILEEHDAETLRIPREFLQPILPPPRSMKGNSVDSDADGVPTGNSRLFLLNVAESEAALERRNVSVAAYLAKGREMGLHKRYVCRNRTPWYAQESRPAPPIACTYIGRLGKSGRPFRFILNRSSATVTNVYLALYPKGDLKAALVADPRLIDDVWHALNDVPPERLLGEGRVYGGGMHKLEPKELGNLRVPVIDEMLTCRSGTNVWSTGRLL